MDGQVRERHPSLTAWLALLVMANGFSAFMYVFMWVSLLLIKSSANSVSQINPLLPVQAATGVASLVFIYAVYKWKKWGVFGFAITTLISFALNMKIGVNNLAALFGLIGITVLVYLVRPYWDQMDSF